MIYVAIGGTAIALGVFGLIDQVRKGPNAVAEVVVIAAIAFGVGLGLIGLGFS